MLSEEEENVAVENFREYLRIPSAHPNVNYDECVKYLQKQASILNLDIHVYTLVEGKPVVVLAWKGGQPELQSVLLNSHMDVAPVSPNEWTRNPFEAQMDEEGNIYARGSQDTKCVGVQYLEAIRYLKSQGFVPKRTVYITYTPDEETGGMDGLYKFVQTKDFKNMNVGFALDEGLTSEDSEFVLFNGERSVWFVTIHFAHLNEGDSSSYESSTGNKVRDFIDHINRFREQENDKLKNNPNLTRSDTTSIRLKKVKNVISENGNHEIVALLDIRVSISESHEHLENLLNLWCDSVGNGTYVTYDEKYLGSEMTRLDSSNLWWVAFKKECDTMNLKLKHTVCPGVTDARCFRAQGIPALGFSPINNTPYLLHKSDEFLNKRVFLQGINIYIRLIQALTTVSITPQL